MEERIKVLEDFVKYYEAEAVSMKYRGTISISVDEQDIEAIEWLIKDCRDGNEMLKAISKENISLRECIRELEERSIPTEKVKELIRVRKERVAKMHPGSDCVLIDDLENQIEVLEELLRGE